MNYEDHLPCPRCGREIYSVEPFYGPCLECRAQLRAVRRFDVTPEDRPSRVYRCSFPAGHTEPCDSTT